MYRIKTLLTAIAFGCLLATGSAQATNTVLLACGEDSCFGPTVVTGSSTVQVTTSSGTFRSAWAREALYVTNSNSTGDPPSNRWTSPLFTASSNIWIHAEFMAGNTNATANQQALIVRSPDGVARILLRQSSTALELKISSRNSVGSFTDLATASSAFSANALHTMDFNINYTCSGSGGVALYIDGVSVASFTGNPCTDSATSLNEIELLSVEGYSGGVNVNCAVATPSTCWSEIIVQNFSTLGEGLLNLTPTGAGNTQGFVPNTLANINKTANND